MPPLKVIGAGFGRTGTMSLQSALERLLGGRCYHMAEVFKNPGHPKLWAQKGRGDPIDFAEVFRNYVAAVDWPVARYYAELADLYPEAKVILTVRDPERWYASTRDTIYTLSASIQTRPVRWFIKARPQMQPVSTMTDDIIWGPRGHFDGRFEDRDHAIAIYEAHIEEVKRTIPAERLLVYEIKQGWEPLCTFLDLPVPSEPMPHVNDRAAMQRRMRILKAVAWLTAPVTLPLSLLRR